jgi:glyoxylase-like metal-dependent hydrolase (beta-lactamase superfamily II)
MCPLGGPLMDARSVGLRGHLVCHCLLIETDQGLVLVDTGFGTKDCAHPRERLSAFFRVLCGPDLDPSRTAVRQLRALGHRPEDVRHVVLTHLDFDHAGGLDDFPRATVHLLEAEKVAAQRQDGWRARGRFRPQQWGSIARWRTYPSSRGEPWFGFDAVRGLAGLPPEILMIPLPGHTEGHAGVAIRTDDGWVLHAGDAYFWHAELDPRGRRCTPGLRAYQTMMEVDRRLRLQNQERLRELAAQREDVTVFCAHDVREFERLADVVHVRTEPASVR